MRPRLIASLIAALLFSAHAQAEDLMQVYREAVTNDSQFASARASLTAGQERTVQGRAGLLPTVGVSGDYTRFYGNDLAADRARSSNGYSIVLTQPLFNWGNYQLYEQGKLATATSEAQFAQAQQDLITRVAQAYFDVLASQDSLAFVRAQKVAISEQLESAKRNFEVGTATITDTHEAQARYDLAVAQEIAGVSDLEIKRSALQQIIGRLPGELASLKTSIVISLPEQNRMDEWVRAAETQNYSVVASQLSLETAKRAISLNRAGYLPTLDLVAARNHSRTLETTSGAGVGKQDIDSVGIQWNIPLFSGFAVTSRVREAIALEDRARNDLETARRNAAQTARQAYLGVTSGLSQVKALEAAEVSSLSALESNKLGYEVGVRINIDVLNAQQQLYSTRRDLAKARYDAIMSGLRLKSAAGTLKEEDLVRVNALLQQ